MIRNCVFVLVWSLLVSGEVAAEGTTDPDGIHYTVQISGSRAEITFHHTSVGEHIVKFDVGRNVISQEQSGNVGGDKEHKYVVVWNRNTWQRKREFHSVTWDGKPVPRAIRISLVLTQWEYRNQGLGLWLDDTGNVKRIYWGNRSVPPDMAKRKGDMYYRVLKSAPLDELSSKKVVVIFNANDQKIPRRGRTPRKESNNDE